MGAPKHSVLKNEILSALLKKFKVDTFFNGHIPFSDHIQGNPNVTVTVEGDIDLVVTGKAAGKLDVAKNIVYRRLCIDVAIT